MPAGRGSQPPAAFDRRTIAGLLALALGAFLLYLPVFDHGLIPTWDDAAYVLNRSEVVSWWTTPWEARLTTPDIGYPIPVPTALYAALHSIAAGEASHFSSALHLSSALLHALATCLAFVVLRRHLGWRLALGVAAIWTVHPAAVEVVAWASNTKTVLYACGVLLAFSAWRSESSWAPWRHALLWVGYFVALGSKPEAAILPVALAVASFGAMGQDASAIRTLVRERGATLFGMLIVGGAVALVATLGHDKITVASSHAPSGILGRAELVLQSLGRVTATMFVPLDLHPAYYFDSSTRLIDAIVGVGALLGWGLLIFVAWRRSRLALGLLATSAVFYVPYAQVMFIPRLAADSYVYVPSLFAYAAIAVLLRSPSATPNSRRSLGLAFAASLVVLAGLSIAQMGRWENGETLFGPVLADNPGAAAPYRHVAYSQWSAGDSVAAAATLDAGADVFAAHQSFPVWAPVVYEAAGQPAKAADAAVRAIVGSSAPPPELARMLLGTLVRAGIALPDAPDVRRAASWAVDRHLEREAWLRENDADLVFGSYFAQQSLWELAAPLLVSAAKRDSTRCQAAALAAGAPADAGIELSAEGCP